MTLRQRSAWIFLAALALSYWPVGCAMTRDPGCDQSTLPCWPDFIKPAADKIVVFFWREANYSGGGRPHLLKVDQHEIGELTGGNYFRLELWPGRYLFSVVLPEEVFFGQTNPPMVISELADFGSGQCGRMFAYRYTDGLGTRGFTRENVESPQEHLSGRILAGALTANDTAQVTTLFNARFEGPAIDAHPHGVGTLAFADGSTYRGLFEHGRPTDAARFFFQDGTIFMGKFYRGRPKSSGVLMTPCGQILFAGRFVDEKPHGLGLRTGKLGPEFCVFAHGRDETPSYLQLAQGILDVQDQARIDAFSLRVAEASARNAGSEDELPHQNTTAQDSEFEDFENQTDPPIPPSTVDQPEAAASEQQTQYSASERLKLIEQLQQSRRERELVKIMELKEDHLAQVEAERHWCAEEFALGRKLCICAPFSPDFFKWTECAESFKGRHPD
jgi:hypothetical protein